VGENRALVRPTGAFKSGAAAGREYFALKSGARGSLRSRSALWFVDAAPGFGATIRPHVLKSLLWFGAAPGFGSAIRRDALTGGRVLRPAVIVAVR
jgi:hypothetical protein